MSSGLIGTRSRRAYCFAQNASKSAGSGWDTSFSGCTPAPPSKNTRLSMRSKRFIAALPSGVLGLPRNDFW